LETECDPITGQSSGGSGSSLVVIDTTSTALDAFRRLVLREMSAAPIADMGSGGKLVGTISDSDVRTLGKIRTGALFLPVLEFLAKIDRHDPDNDDDDDDDEDDEEKEDKKKDEKTNVNKKKHYTMCSKTDTLAMVIDKILAEHSKRAWIVDSSQRPLGVVSMTDLIRAVYLDRMQQGNNNEDPDSSEFSSSTNDTSWISHKNNC